MEKISKFIETDTIKQLVEKLFKADFEIQEMMTETIKLSDIRQAADQKLYEFEKGTNPYSLFLPLPFETEETAKRLLCIDWTEHIGLINNLQIAKDNLEAARHKRECKKRAYFNILQSIAREYAWQEANI